jgi:hypothetical protein
LNLTAQDIITDAMKEIGVLASGETPTATELNDTLRALNMMLDSWSARKLLSLAGIQEPFPLTHNKYIYFIGLTAFLPNFTTSKPISISDAFIRDGNGVDSHLEIVGMDLYDSYGDKSFSITRPTTIAYDPGLTQQATQLGTIYVYPIPDNSTPYTLYITQQKYLTEFSALSTSVTFPASYMRALKFSLALEIYGNYFNESKTPIPARTVRLAQESMRILETVNAKRVAASMDIPGRVNVFNIYTGDDTQ